MKQLGTYTLFTRTHLAPAFMMDDIRPLTSKVNRVNDMIARHCDEDVNVQNITHHVEHGAEAHHEGTLMVVVTLASDGDVQAVIDNLHAGGIIQTGPVFP